jgi:FG-GAP repeat
MKTQHMAASVAILVSMRAVAGDEPIPEPQLIIADDPASSDRFGTGVAAQGGTAVIGALTSQFGTDTGAAYVLERDADGLWHQIAKVMASDGAQHDAFAYSVAIDGDTFAAAATGDDDFAPGSGAAYVFERDVQGVWREMKKVAPSDPTQAEGFGRPAISADTLVVTAVFKDGDVVEAGAAYIFERNAGGPDNWGEVMKLQPDDLEEFANFGSSVAIEGDLVAVGAHRQGSTGAVYLFGRNVGGLGNWGLLKKLAPTGACDIGVSVALQGDVLVTGASAAHSVLIFERDWGGADNWGLVKSISRGNQSFGVAVALTGDVLLVGDSGNSNGYGKARVYERNEGGADHWGEVAVLTVDSDFPQLFGAAVAADGASLLVAAPYHSDPISTMGAVYAYTLDSDDDGVVDSADNCIDVSNADQRDTDADGFGNACDADFNDDCNVDFADLQLMKTAFFRTGDLDADLNGDGSVNFADLGILKQGFFAPPGPSGVPNLCSP